MPESDTSMRGYLAALYAGTMLFILGFTPEQWMSSESCNREDSFSLTNILAPSEYSNINIWILLH